MGQLLKKEEGLFTCKRCGACCKGRDVQLTLDDIFLLSEFMNVMPDEFFSEYCVERTYGEDKLFLPFLRRDGESCCFLEDNICQVHFVKPAACEHMPSTIFGSLENIRGKMPPDCAIKNTRLESGNDQKRRNFMAAMMLTTIYYSKFGTFKFEHAKPFIYRILLFKKNRDQIFKIIGNKTASN
jgi:Fe-S-cluster containining protein